jgi:hypothetical protein
MERVQNLTFPKLVIGSARKALLAFNGSGLRCVAFALHKDVLFATDTKDNDSTTTFWSD